MIIAETALTSVPVHETSCCIITFAFHQVVSDAWHYAEFTECGYLNDRKPKCFIEKIVLTQ